MLSFGLSSFSPTPNQNHNTQLYATSYQLHIASSHRVLVRAIYTSQVSSLTFPASRGCVTKTKTNHLIPNTRLHHSTSPSSTIYPSIKRKHTSLTDLQGQVADLPATDHVLQQQDHVLQQQGHVFQQQDQVLRQALRPGFRDYR